MADSKTITRRLALKGIPLFAAIGLFPAGAAALGNTASVSAMQVLEGLEDQAMALRAAIDAQSGRCRDAGQAWHDQIGACPQSPACRRARAIARWEREYAAFQARRVELAEATGYAAEVRRLDLLQDEMNVIVTERIPAVRADTLAALRLKARLAVLSNEIAFSIVRDLQAWAG